MVCRVAVLESSVKVTLTEVCRGLKDLQVTAKNSDGESVSVEVQARDCDKNMTIVIPDAKSCIVEIS